MTTEDNEDAELELSCQFQASVLAVVNDGPWVGHPHAVLHGLLELAGALAGAMLPHDAARPDVVLGMVNVLAARVARDAALIGAPSTEVRH